MPEGQVLRAVLFVLATGAPLVACGIDDAPPDVRHPDAETASPHPKSSDEFGGRLLVSDYTYTLRRDCFCGDGGIPVTVTVREGEAVNAEYAGTGPGYQVGARAERWSRLSISDILSTARKAEAGAAYHVDVEWPDGQGYPSAVEIDHDVNGHDDEVTYHISNVASD